jgi:Ca-activated chloride channel family protein
MLTLVTSGWAQSGRNRPKQPSPPSGSPATKSTPTENPNPPTNTANPTVQYADPSEVQNDDSATLKIDATLVTVPVVVSDRSGRYLPFLKNEDFTLFEDGVNQDITFFASERTPFNVAMVLDTSRSIVDSLDAIQESAVRFTRELKEDDRVMVMEFNSRIEVLNDFTNDRYKIRHSIETTRARGGTRLHDALHLVAEKIKPLEGRKAVILLTDGEDTESNKSQRDAIEAIIEIGALLYVISYPASASIGNAQPTFGGPPTFPGGGRGRGGTQYADVTFLRQLVKDTGGDLYHAGGRNGLPDIWRKIADDLRHVYVLGYYPTNAIENGGQRAIRVQLKDREAGAVRYRQKYSANKIKQTAKN